MYKYKRRCWCVMILFALFSVMSVPALADDIAIPIEESEYTQEELEQGVYTGSGGLSVYLDGVEQDNTGASTYGLVSDKSNVVSIGYDVYSSTFNWRTEEQFTPTSDIGYTKLFTATNAISAFQDSKISVVESLEPYTNGIIGETIVLHYIDANGENVLPEGSKISLDLSFNDKSLGTTFCLKWNQKSPYAFISDGETSTGSTSDLLTYTSNSIGKMSNVVTVYSVNSDDEQSLLGTYYDVDNINTTFTASSDVVAVYIDVQYNPSNLNLLTVTSKGYTYFWLPLFFKLDLSGEILVDTSGVNTGLLKGIIEWLKNILNAILALPQQIADKVIEGVKSLFVPSAEDLQPKFDEFKTAAYNKLGFVYQVATDFIDLLQELFSATVSPTTTLTIPQIALPWDKVDGGQMVLLQETTFNVFPENLEGLRTLCKTITSMVLVLAFYRSVLSAFEKFFKE